MCIAEMEISLPSEGKCRKTLILRPLSQSGYDLCTDEQKEIDSDIGLSL